MSFKTSYSDFDLERVNKAETIRELYPVFKYIKENMGTGGGSNAVNVIDVTHPDFGVIGDGSDESAKLQAAFDAAAALRGDGRPEVYIPPGLGIYIGTANLVLLDKINLKMRGSYLDSACSSVAALTCGADGYSNENGVYEGITIYRSADTGLAQDTIGLRIINPVRCRIDQTNTDITGFRRPMQIRAAYGPAGEAQWAAYNEIFLGRLDGKYGLSLLNANYNGGYGAWINSNSFHGGDFFTTQKDCGSVAGVIYELGVSAASMPEDGLSLQHNHFYSPTFQLQVAGGEPFYSNGGTAVAGRCYFSGGYMYRCTTAGVMGGTALHSLSIVRNANITSGTAHFTVEGQYVRAPFLFDDCGYAMQCDSPYWEGGEGAFLVMRGANAGAGHRVRNVFIGGSTNVNRLVMDRTGDRDNWTAATRWLNNLVTIAPQSIDTTQGTGESQLIRQMGWHLKAIKGDTKWTCPGLVGRDVHTLTGGNVAGYRIGKGMILSDGIATYQLGVLIPCEDYKRLRIAWRHVSGEVLISQQSIVAYDANLSVMDIGAGTSSPPLVMADNGSVDSLFGVNEIATNRTNWESFVAVADSVKYLFVSYSWGNAGSGFDGIEVEAFLDKFTGNNRPFQFAEPFSRFDEQRFSHGTPKQGYFIRQGEIITNADASGVLDSTLGWIVKTPGILAPAWAASTEVWANELRENGGRVYAAGASGTTGATAPTGTGSVSDGTITWTYVDDEAVLSVLPKYEPWDTRKDLDYSPYHVGTFEIGTDGDADGLSNGVTLDPYGDQTGITYAYTVTGGKQNYRINRSGSASYSNGARLEWAAPVTSGKDYFLLLKGSNFTQTSLTAAISFAAHTDASNYTSLVSSSYAPDGFPQGTDLGEGKADGTVVLACRFTAPFNASTVATQIDVAAFSGLPQDAAGSVDEFWVIDLEAAETALSISLAGLDAGELYAIINTALTYVPPISLRLTDIDDSAVRTVTVGSGIIEVDGVPMAGGGVVSWGSITGTLSSQTDLNSALSGKEASISAGTTSQYWRGDKSWQTLNKDAVNLSNVENTALSTWAGSSSITTLGTISAGVWNGTAIGDSYISSASAWNAKEGAISAGTSTQYWRGDKTWQTLNLGAIGQSSATSGQVPTWSGTAWVPQTPSSSGAAWGSITGTLSSQTDLNSALSGKEASISAGTTSQYWRGDKSWQTLDKAAVSLNNVENTALSTWAGSSFITTLGTISAGVWNGTAIGDSYISSASAWNAKEGAISAGTSTQYWRGDKTWQTLNLGAIGQSGATTDQVPKWNGSAWVPYTPSSGGSSSYLTTSISTDTTLGASHTNYVVSLTGSTDRTLTFTAAATLGNGWMTTVENTGTAKWAINETVDGVAPVSSVAFHVLPGEKRLFYVASGAFYSTPLRPLAWTVTATTTFRWPSGYYSFADSYLIGAGGGGGRSDASGTAVGGAAGGCFIPINGMAVPSAGTSVTATIGASGTAATGAGNGGVGGTTTFSWSGFSLNAYGGGGGGSAGGSGGSAGWKGAGGSGNGATEGTGGDPTYTATNFQAGGFAGCPGTTGSRHNAFGGAVNGGSALYGGAASGMITAGNTVTSPGSSYFLNQSAGTSSVSGTATAGGIGCGGGSSKTGTAADGGRGQIYISAQ